MRYHGMNGGRVWSLNGHPSLIRTRAMVQNWTIMCHEVKSKYMCHPWKNQIQMDVNIQKAMENHHFLMGKSTISMVIFNSYVRNYQRVRSSECSIISLVLPFRCLWLCLRARNFLKPAHVRHRRSRKTGAQVVVACFESQTTTYINIAVMDAKSRTRWLT